MFNRRTIQIPQWLVEELTPFASGRRSWDLWENWLEMSGARASRELDEDWFRRITSTPRTEVLRLLKAAGIATVPIHPERTKYDPLEDNEHFAAVIAEANRLAYEEGGDVARGFGGCHLFWKIKKRILKNEFGLDWKSPAELNPYMMFD
jgi:hypothetical protein